MTRLNRRKSTGDIIEVGELVALLKAVIDVGEQRLSGLRHTQVTGNATEEIRFGVSI